MIYQPTKDHVIKLTVSDMSDVWRAQPGISEKDALIIATGFGPKNGYPEFQAMEVDSFDAYADELADDFCKSNGLIETVSRYIDAEAILQDAVLGGDVHLVTLKANGTVRHYVLREA